MVDSKQPNGRILDFSPIQIQNLLGIVDPDRLKTPATQTGQIGRASNEQSATRLLLQIRQFIGFHIALDPGDEQLVGNGQYHWTHENAD